MTLFNKKFRIESTRLKDHDYSSVGDYYVTICVGVDYGLFGSVEHGVMCLNGAGETAKQIWETLPADFNNITLGDFIIMPDHMHGVINIVKQSNKTLFDMVGAFKSKSSKDIGTATGIKWGEVWQKGFYDRIIRNEYEYYFVSEYIKNNPLKTDPDNYYKEWYELIEVREEIDKNKK